jgi:hypothetical protein
VVVTGHEAPSLLAAADHVTWCTDGTTYELGTPAQACAADAFRRGYLGPGFDAATPEARVAAARQALAPGGAHGL